ncbi:hypothetical protein K466DRAFT_275999 [Polyporus arcularius HHB13444]|uniref:Pentacotripeptide-repeat region of PRORP domain-containing protein n=1 Tax=Polyporus arcularius HHB13444 TaxID=1314778 RepID=A0A5C3P176_9APHY|nr:hypothetical protein K466DRAFT_275999 [Polyporus arcularius HHB13444]
MLLRTASHGIPPAITLDFLVPSPILRRTLCQASTRNLPLALPYNVRGAALSSQATARGSSPTLTPGAVIAHLDQQHHVFESQPLDTLTNTQIEAFNKAIPELRAAFMERDVSKLRAVWVKVKTRKLLAFFGHPQYLVVSKGILNHCLNTPRRAPFTKEENNVLSEMALFNATAGWTDGLRALMLRAVWRKQSRDALTLYDRYLSALRSKALLRDWEAEPSQPAEATSHSSPPAPSPIRDEILLCAVTAYADSDAFRDALHVYLRAGTRISPSTLEDFLPLVRPDLRSKVEEYARRLDTASLLSRPEALMKHLLNLTRDNAAQSLTRLYTHTIAGAQDPDPWLAVESADLSETRVVLLPHFFWPSFLKSFLSLRRTDLAMQLWDDMLKLGVVPQPVTWNALLDGYARNREVDSVLSTWDLMTTQGVKHDALSYRALIHALYQAGRYEEGEKHFAAFEKEFVKPGGSHDEAILVVYNTHIHDLLFVSRDQAAYALLEKMETHGPKPDIVTYNTFLRYNARKGDLKAMAQLLRKLEPRGIVADNHTFSTILSAMLKVRPDADKMMINFMKKQGVEPDTTSLTAVIDHLVRERTLESFRAAMDLLTKMERNEYPNAEPNEITYTSLLTGINRGDWLEPSVAADCSKQIWERMRSRGIRPNRSTYNVLIRASLGYPGREGVEGAMAYYRDMLKERVHMGNDTWYVLLRGLADRKEIQLAAEVVEDMRRLKRDNMPQSLRILAHTIIRLSTSNSKRSRGSYL